MSGEKGLEGWVELFAGGKQTDSKGVSRFFTLADLDQMVANHSPIPHVITHDELYSPFAYGWTSEVKREGDTILAKSDQINPDFAQLLESGALKERSVRIGQSDKGWELKHIAWLGAQPPAVKGLAPVQFSADTESTFDFSMNKPTKDTPMEITEEQLAAAKAEAAKEAAAKAKADTEAEFQEKLDQQAADHEKQLADQTAEFQKAADEAAAEQFKQVLDDAIAEGRLLPAQALGAAEFAAMLPADTFDFSAAEGKTESVSARQWFTDFMANMPKQIAIGDPGGEGDESDVDLSDAEAIAAKAVEYQREQAKKGISITTSVAVDHVSKGGES